MENRKIAAAEEGTDSGYFWNTAAGLVNAGKAVILSMVVTRTDSLADAGVLSLAFAAGNLMRSVGTFGVRNYQATDLKERFTFTDYFWSRILTVCLMAVVSGLYLLYGAVQKGYDAEKTTVIAAVCFIYIVEAVEDVFWGLYQQNHAIGTGAKVFLARWVSILCVMIGLLAFGMGLAWAAVGGATAGMAVFPFVNGRAFKRYHKIIGRMRIRKSAGILKQCFPLAVAAFMTLYTANAPKYAIDAYLTEEIQACYGFIAMPVFVIELLNGFLYQPKLVQTAVEWNTSRFSDFRRRCGRQCMAIFALTVICLIGAGLCGIPVLSVLYGTNLSGYKAELLILLLGGGMLAYVGYFCVLLTVMRMQKLVMSGYILAAFVSMLLCDPVTARYGLKGACIFYTAVMTALALFFAIAYMSGVRCAQKRKGQNGENITYSCTSRRRSGQSDYRTGGF